MSRIPLLLSVLVAIMSPRLASGLSCPGDCDQSGAIGVHELLTVIGIDLSGGNPAQCSSADLDQSNTITVDEVVGAVERSLHGCRSAAAASAGALAVANALQRLPELVRAVGVALDGAGGSTECALGGTLEGECEQVSATIFQIPMRARDCLVESIEGNVLYVGDTRVTGLGRCDVLDPTPNALNFAFAWNGTIEDDSGSPLLDTRMDLRVRIHQLDIRNSPCPAIGASSAIDGTLVFNPTAGREMAVVANKVETVTAFADFVSDTLCEPKTITLTADGPVHVTDGADDDVVDIDAVFSHATVVVHRDTRLVEIDATVDSSCFGGAAHLTTVAPVDLLVERSCLATGVLRLDTPLGSVELTFGTGGSVQVDDGADGAVESMFASCLDVPAGACR